jgi:dihydroorotate dehydrogenase (fumarate)
MNLSTQYLGLTLKNPIVASASPLSRTVGSIEQLAVAGASAIVLYSLFEEQIEQKAATYAQYQEFGNESRKGGRAAFNTPSYSADPDDYFALIARAKKAVDIPIIASLNGITPGAWVNYAQSMQEAGADAIELNVYYIPVNHTINSAQVEDRYVSLLHDVRSVVTIPVAMKLSPFFTALPHFAQRLADNGAEGLVLFNRYYQPDIEIDDTDTAPRIRLSESGEMRLPLRWVSLMYGHINTDLAISTGVHTYKDVLKGVMAGAKVTMMASALLQYGVDHIETVLQEMRRWMERRGYESVYQIQGNLSHVATYNPEQMARADYMQVLDSWGQVTLHWELANSSGMRSKQG